MKSTRAALLLQADPEVFATSGSDRSVALYDLRHSTPVRKIVMQTKTNAMSWNPMEPLNFVVANEDCNLYSYDMRKLDTAFCVHEVCPLRLRKIERELCIPVLPAISKRDPENGPDYLEFLHLCGNHSCIRCTLGTSCKQAALAMYASVTSFTPEREVAAESPKAQSCNACKTSKLTRIAQQHHM